MTTTTTHTAHTPTIRDNYLSIVTLLHTARTKLKYPSIKIVEPTPFKLSIAGNRARYPGSINITSGLPYQDPANIFYGRITVDGMLLISNYAAAAYTYEVQQIINFLQHLAANPTKVAIAYANRTCNCMFCGRTLTTKESKLVGYGPVCAETFGLPWGEEEDPTIPLNLL